MKAEHRHELKTNDLAKSLVSFGDYAKEYGGRVVLALAVVILTVVLIRNRIQSSHAEALKVRDELAYAGQQTDRLRNVSFDRSGRATVTPDDPEIQNVRKVLASILEKSSDKPIRAQALATQGDFCWNLANYPDLPNLGTDKRAVAPPPEERVELMKQAKQAYEQVVQQCGDQLFPAVDAHMGLAAIAENAREWDAAKQHYEAVKNMPNVLKVFKDLADMKLKRLAEVQKPLLIGYVPEKFELPNLPTTQPSTQPTTQPAGTQPATKATVSQATPTTRPTGTESSPATRPATAKPAGDKPAANKTPADKKPANNKPADQKSNTPKPDTTGAAKNNTNNTTTPAKSPTTRPSGK